MWDSRALCSYSKSLSMLGWGYVDGTAVSFRLLHSCKPRCPTRYGGVFAQEWSLIDSYGLVGKSRNKDVSVAFCAIKSIC